MMTLSLLAIGVAVLFAAVSVMSVAAATREPQLIPAGVGPVPNGYAFPLETNHSPSRLPSEPSDWNIVELNNIFSVETLLDNLEASHASNTEVELTGENTFKVRWR